MTTSDERDTQRTDSIGRDAYPEFKHHLDRFRALLDYSDDAILMVEVPTNQIIEMNRSACDQLGYSRDQVVGYPLGKFVSSAEEIHTYLISDTPPTYKGQMFTAGLSTVSGEEVPVEIKVQRVTLKNEVYGILVAHDISGWLRMEAVLRHSEERYHDLFSKMPVALYRTTPQGDFIDANTALVELLGYTDKTTLMATNAHSYYADPDERLRWQALLERDDIIRGFDTQFRRVDGKIIWVRNTARLVRDANGSILYYEGSLEDITERKQAKEALVEEHNLLKTLIENIPDLIYVKDAESRFVMANEAVAQIMSTTQEEIIGKTDYDFFPAELAQEYYTDEQNVIQTDQALVDKEEIVLDQGEPRWYLTTKAPFRDSRGRTRGLVGIGRDITKRKMIEQALRLAYDELELRVKQRTAELTKANEQLATLYQIGQTITARLQLNAVLDAIARSTAHLLDSDTGAILLLDETGEVLTIQGAYGLNEQVVQGTRDRIGESIAGRVAQSGQPVIANDLLNDPRFENPAAIDERLLACASVPLIVNEKIIGTLDVHSKSNPYAFDESHIHMLSMFANQAAIAIENARLYEALQSAHDQLELRVQERTAELKQTNEQLQTEITERKQAEQALRTTLMRTEILYRTGRSLIAVTDLPMLLQIVVDGVAEALPADQVTLTTFDVERQQISHFVTGGASKQQANSSSFAELWHGLSGQVYREQTPVFSPHHEGGSIAAVPIEYGGETMGVIIATNRPDQRDFEPPDVDLMMAMASQAAIAIQDTQLFAAEQEQRRFAEALRDTVGAVTSTLDFDEVLMRILENIERVVPHDAANIMRREDNNFVSMVGSRGYDTYGPTAWTQLADYPKTRLALEAGMGYIIADAQSDPDWVEFSAASWIRSHIGVSIRLENQVLGVLHLDSRQPNAFTENHLKRLQAFADQVAIAIQNAQLFAAEQKRRHISEILRQASTVLGSTLQLDTILHLLLKQLRQVIPFDSASVQQRRGENLGIVACEGFEQPEAVLGLVFPLIPQLPNYQVVITKASLALDNINEEYSQNFVDIYSSGHIRSWLGIPLIVKDEIVGVITLDRNTVHPYTTEETELAMAFANQAAIAIENARLYLELEDYSTSLEHMVEARTEELRHTKEHIEAILNSVGEALVVVAPDGTIQQVNPAFETQTGYRPDEIESSHISLLRGDATPLNQFGEMIAAMRKGKKWEGEIFVRRKNSTVYDAAVTISPIHRSKAEPVAFVSSIRDISGLKEVERMKDAFVSNVSHELRTPISNLKLRYHLLMAQPAKFETHLAVIRRETDRLTQIIEDLLNLSRIDQERISWNPTSVDINTLVEEYVEDRIALAERRDISLSFAEEPNLPIIQVDMGLISQAFGILLTNALNYTPIGGWVKVRTERKEWYDQQWIVLSVRDNGRGIPPHEQPRLFERFFRGTAGIESGAPGTGLGLSIAHEIMKKHLGRINVSSSGVPGEGAEFSLWLPIK